MSPNTVIATVLGMACRHDEQVRRRAALLHAPALHAEPVLLVDHHEARSWKASAPGSARRDHDPRVAGHGVVQRTAARPSTANWSAAPRGRDVGAAQLATHREVAQQRGDGPVVLHGEHLGRREQGRPPAGVDDRQHRAQRHDGLPDPTSPCRSRCIGSRASSRSVSPRSRAARRSARRAAARRTPRADLRGEAYAPSPPSPRCLCASLGEDRLEHERLVVPQPVHPDLDVVLEPRPAGPAPAPRAPSSPRRSRTSSGTARGWPPPSRRPARPSCGSSAS